MRAAFVRTLTGMMERDDRVVLLLADISVHAFRDAARRWPERVINVGVSEAAAVGLAAGLAKSGFYPVIHSIAPFVTSRVHEFVRNDLAMHGLAAAVVSVGASHDYSSLAATHYGPDDVALMLAIPGVRCYVPGDAGEAGELLTAARQRPGVAYIRLSETTHTGVWARAVADEPLVIAIGSTMRYVPQGASCIYVNDLSLLQRQVLAVWPERVLVLEPFYEGTVTHLITDALRGQRVEVRSVGVPRAWPGLQRRTDDACGLSVGNVRRVLEEMR